MNVVAAWRATAPLSIRNAIARLRRYINPAAGAAYYSGHGEDALIVSWLRHYGADLSKIRYVDIGAFHPIILSNTYALYRLGARGVLIEPDPAQASLLRKMRPNDIVVNAGAAFDERRIATLFLMTSRSFNTFSREQAEALVASSRDWSKNQRQEIIGTIEVPLIPINDIISNHLASHPPHVVSIDTEGADYQILKSLDLTLLSCDPDVPCLICIEDSEPLENVRRILEPGGFGISARTPANWLYLRYRREPTNGRPIDAPDRRNV